MDKELRERTEVVLQQELESAIKLLGRRNVKNIVKRALNSPLPTAGAILTVAHVTGCGLLQARQALKDNGNDIAAAVQAIQPERFQ